MATAVSFISDGVVVPANFYAPAAPQRGAALVVAYGADGLTDDQSGPWATMIDTIAGEIAALGIPVTVPDYFRATDTAPGLFRDGIEAGLAQIMTHRQAWQRPGHGSGRFVHRRWGL